MDTPGIINDLISDFILDLFTDSILIPDIMLSPDF
jgi:hypothetical protein